MSATLRLLIVILPVTLATPASAVEFLRGDMNEDGNVSIADIQFFYNWTFRLGPAPGCRDAADANDDAIYNPREGVWIFRHLVLDDVPPPPPYPEVGEDPTDDDDFDCVSYGGGEPVDDAGALVEILDANGVAGEGGIARITIAISSLRSTSAYFGSILDEAGVLAESSNDQLISRPPTEPDLAIVDLTDSVRVNDGTPVGKMMAARVLGGRLTFGLVPTIRVPSHVPPGESIEILRIEVPLRPGVEPGEYALSFERAELAEVSGRAIPSPTLDGVLRIVRGPVLLRGDCNGDGRAVEVSDAQFLLNFNFVGATTPICIAACDADGDGVVTGQTTDALYLLQFAFLGGPAPLDPFPSCGMSGRATDLDLGCDEELPCF